MFGVNQFCWGFFGSMAVEVVLLCGYYRRGVALPLRYRRPGFWLTRFLLAFLAGGLVVAYGISTPVLALHLGAATPLVIQALAHDSRRFIP
jgi:hypothetical protein